MAHFRVLQHSHIIYSCNLIWVFTVFFVICIKSGKIFGKYIMDALTTSREDSTLYCINSQKKIINHKLVENEGDFLVQLSFPCTLLKWRTTGHSDDVNYHIIINDVIVLTRLQSTTSFSLPLDACVWPQCERKKENWDEWVLWYINNWIKNS